MNKALLWAGLCICFLANLVAATDVYFSPKDNISKKIIECIKGSNHKIDIMVYHITDNRISKELIQAKFRGVTIRLIVDSDKKGNFNKHSEEHYLKSRGIAVKRMSGIKEGIMHNKVAIFDERKALTGSYNWTITADKLNYENILITDDEAVIRSYQMEFNSLWFK